MKKYILFDHDGVLVDTEFWYLNAGKRALAEVGFALNRDQYVVDMARGGATWAQARRSGISENLVSQQRHVRDQYYQEYLRSEDIEIDGVIEALEELTGLARMAIVTTSSRADFDVIHEHRAITTFMDFVLTLEDYENPKPHPEPYLTALKRFEAEPEEALVVEDSARGLMSAVAAGIDCAIVKNEFTTRHDFSDAKYRIRHLGEIASLIVRDDLSS